jgi:hypothetical protein
MKVTIEYDEKADAIDALNGTDWRIAVFELDQELRGMVKHGCSRNKDLNETELEVFAQCREMLQQVMKNNDLTFNV